MKIKNANYSQAEGRAELFESRSGQARAGGYSVKAMTPWISATVTVRRPSTKAETHAVT